MHPLASLLSPGPFPDGVNRAAREQYLSAEEYVPSVSLVCVCVCFFLGGFIVCVTRGCWHRFQATFKMDQAAFDKLPGWKKASLKRAAKLF